MLTILEQMSSPTLKTIEKVASKGTLNKGTWNHCVFNAAGEEYGIQVVGINAACAVSSNAADFIRYWDSHSDYTTDDLLRDVRIVLSTRNDVAPDFEEVNMGRVKAVRRRSISRSTMLTTEELEANFQDELETMLVDA